MSEKIILVPKDDKGIFVEMSYKSPISNWEELSQSVPMHAAVSASSEEIERNKSLDHVEFLLENLSDGTILDVGCGYGRIAKYLLPKRKYESYIGLDSSYNMLSIFKDRHNSSAEEIETELFLVNSDIDKLPIENESVDNVIVSAVFLHNPKKITKSSIKEIHRVLKRGGKLIVLGSFPNKTTLTGLQGMMYLAFLFLIGKKDKNGPVRYFSNREVRRLLKDFSDINIVTVGSLIIPKDILFIKLPKLRGFYRTKIADPINSWLSKTFIGKSLFAKTHFDVVAKK